MSPQRKNVVCAIALPSLCLPRARRPRSRPQLLRNGGLSSARDDSTPTLRGVCGFLAVRVLRVRAVCRTITILVASQTKKIHSGEHPQRRVRVPFCGTGAGKEHHRCLAAGTGPSLPCLFFGVHPSTSIYCSFPFSP